MPPVPRFSLLQDKVGEKHLSKNGEVSKKKKGRKKKGPYHPRTSREKKKGAKVHFAMRVGTGGEKNFFSFPQKRGVEGRRERKKGMRVFMLTRHQKGGGEMEHQER